MVEIGVLDGRSVFYPALNTEAFVFITFVLDGRSGSGMRVLSGYA